MKKLSNLPPGCTDADIEAQVNPLDWEACLEVARDTVENLGLFDNAFDALNQALPDLTAEELERLIEELGLW